jgi:hypothetical protein
MCPSPFCLTVLKNKLWEILFLTYEDRFEEGEGGGREPG